MQVYKLRLQDRSVSWTQMNVRRAEITKFKHAALLNDGRPEVRSFLI